jgi:transcriptional regulator with XRE-family HTH domain
MREAKRLQKRVLASRCGSSYSHIDNVENGRRGVSDELLSRIAHELDTTVEEIEAEAAKEAVVPAHVVDLLQRLLDELGVAAIPGRAEPTPSDAAQRESA